jgi:hypothetical protein
MQKDEKKMQPSRRGEGVPPLCPEAILASLSLSCRELGTAFQPRNTRTMRTKSSGTADERRCTLIKHYWKKIYDSRTTTGSHPQIMSLRAERGNLNRLPTTGYRLLLLPPRRHGAHGAASGFAHRPQPKSSTKNNVSQDCSTEKKAEACPPELSLSSSSNHKS